MAVTIKKIMKVIGAAEDIMGRLEELLEQKQEVLDNAKAADYPNKERIELLSAQVDILQESKDNIEEAISFLDTYE